MLKLVRYKKIKLCQNRMLGLSNALSDEFENKPPKISTRNRRKQDPKYNTPKGEFNGEFQGYGNVDRLDEMFYPEWRT